MLRDAIRAVGIFEIGDPRNGCEPLERLRSYLVAGDLGQLVKGYRRGRRGENASDMRQDGFLRILPVDGRAYRDPREPRLRRIAQEMIPHAFRPSDHRTAIRREGAYKYRLLEPKRVAAWAATG